MRIVRFSGTLWEVERRLKQKYPDARPVRGATNDQNHTPWMIRRIRRLDGQRKVIAWYNWVLAKAHTTQLFDVGDDELTEIRTLARRDAVRLRKR